MLLSNVIIFSVVIIATVCWTQSIRWSQLNKVDQYILAATNYCTAFIVFACIAWSQKLIFDYSLLFIGAISGVLFSISFFLFLRCIRINGVAKVAVVRDISLIIPICAGIFLWNEQLSTIKLIGILMALCVIPLIMSNEWSLSNFSFSIELLILVILFILQGVSYTIFKWFGSIAPMRQQFVLLTGLFGGALLCSVIMVIWNRGRIDLNGIKHGVLTGLFNVVATLTLLYSMIVFPISLAAPTITIGTLVLTTLTSICLWRERYTIATFVGLIIGIAAATIINL